MEEKLRRYVVRKFLLYPKTTEVVEVREELYSIMLDKYNDSLRCGNTKARAYEEALELMSDYKEALKEIEQGSSLGALKSNLFNLGSFSAFYFLFLTFIYFSVSQFMIKSFHKTWLIPVGGSFIYLVYFSVGLYKYARLFNFRKLLRWSLAAIYLSMIPLIYVFPSLYLSVVHSRSIWSTSWLVVIVLVFFYLLTDYMVNRKQISVVEQDAISFSAGFVFTTFLYLILSLKFKVWGIAWVLYVLYLSVLSLYVHLRSKRRTKGGMVLDELD